MIGDFPEVLNLQPVISQTQPVHLYVAAGSPHLLVARKESEFRIRQNNAHDTWRIQSMPLGDMWHHGIEDSSVRLDERVRTKLSVFRRWEIGL